MQFLDILRKCLVLAILLLPSFATAGLVLYPSESTPSGRSFTIVCDDGPQAQAPRMPEGRQLVAGLVMIPAEGRTTDHSEFGLDELPENCRWVETTGMSGGEVNAFLGGYTTMESLEQSLLGETVEDNSDNEIGDQPDGQSTSGTIGLVPDCPVGEPGCEEAFVADNYGPCEFMELTNNVIRFLLGLSAVIAMFAILYAGYLFVISQGDSATIQRGKQFILNVMIGFVIMLSAYLVVSTVLSVLLGTSIDGLEWAQLECSYANAAADPNELKISLDNFYEFDDEGYAIGYRPTTLTTRTVTMTKVVRTINGREVVTYQSSNPAIAGACEIVTSGYCTPSSLAPLFPGNAEAASRVCAQESGGVSQWSRTDLCKDGNSFSGGWFQINIIAHANRIPGCSGAFAVYGRGTQGSCLDSRTSRSGISYCAVRDCEVIDVDRYNACRRAVEQWSVNSSIASDLYRESGNDFTPWQYSAKHCGAPY